MALDWGSLPVDVTPSKTLLEMLKDYLGITDGSEDEVLNRAISMAGEMMETHLDRIVAKRPIDQYFAHHFGTVELHNMPVDVAEPLNVFLEGELQTDYEVVQRRGQVAILSRIGHQHDAPMDWRRYDQVTVTYTGGYDPIPSDLAYALCIVAGDIHRAEGTGTPPGGASGDVRKQTITGVGSIEYDTGGSTSGGGGGLGAAWGVIPATAAQIVSKYKKIYA